MHITDSLKRGPFAVAAPEGHLADVLPPCVWVKNLALLERRDVDVKADGDVRVARVLYPVQPQLV